jgi:hypothetical protein
MNGSSASVILDLFAIDCLGYFAELRELCSDGSRGAVLCSSHIHSDKSDAFREVFDWLASCEAVTA